MKDIDRVGIIGSGVIGASWSALFLASGREVVNYDPNPDNENLTKRYIEKAWGHLEELGSITDGASPSRIRFVGDPAAAVEGCGFIQESVPERLEIKHETYKRIEPALGEDAVLSTSSSGLLLGDMQAGLKDASRLIVGHPFNPPHLIPLVELLGNANTAGGVLDRAAEFYLSCGKVTIRVNKEVPAHVANRLQAALWREAISLVAEGVASVEDVDKAVTAGPGLRWSVMGPHMLFSLGSGGGGMKTFCERYGPSFRSWWDSMGTPDLTPEVIDLLERGIREEEDGRDFDTLSAERDAKLIASMKALKGIQS
ncbi:3-hydroxyacyl-CoA dehydrogenase NAD-binding domain-containing protein [Alphaproteobacteria bacterium LSUCC0684]